MRSTNLLFVATIAALTLPALSQDTIKVIRQSEPEKALIIELSVPATQAEVWKAFTTSEGLSTWLTPGAVVDLRSGGEWTAHYPGGHTGGGTILSFTPQQELTLAAMAPEQFPTVRSQRTTAKFEFIAEGSSTRIRLTQTGWKTGDEWDKAYDYLAKGNAQLLWALHRRFVSGPIDWQKEWGDAGKEESK
jgi:uncharacterized protein YndB with AHSA1/START domain